MWSTVCFVGSMGHTLLQALCVSIILNFKVVNEWII